LKAYAVSGIASAMLLAFTSDSPRSTYNIPIAAYSVSSADLDLDGDMDIVTGHIYNWQTNWSGISILDNLGSGHFILKDSLFFMEDRLL